MFVYTNGIFDQSLWITELHKANPSIKFKDLTYPGAHDALTFDLGVEIPYYEDIGSLIRVWPLRQFSSALVGSVIRSFSQTQIINITDMLDGGIRLLDLRATVKDYVYDKQCLDSKWWGYHGVITNKPFQEYIDEIARWINKPKYRSEILILMISYHGDSDCSTNCWNNIPSSCIQRLFTETVDVLGRNILFNKTSHNVSSVSIGDIIRSGQRIILLWSESELLTHTNDRDFAIDQASTTCQNNCKPILDTGSLRNISDKLFRLNMSFSALVRHNRDRLSIMGLENSILPCVAKVGAVRAIDKNFCKGNQHSTIISSGWCSKCEDCFNTPSGIKGCPWVTMKSNAAIVNYYTQRPLDTVVRYSEHYRFPSIVYQDMIALDGRVIIDPYSYDVSSPYVETIVLDNFIKQLPYLNLTFYLREKYVSSFPVKNLPTNPEDGIYPQNGPKSWPNFNKCHL